MRWLYLFLSLSFSFSLSSRLGTQTLSGAAISESGFFAVDLDALQAALLPFTGAGKDLRRRAIAALANHGHRTPPQLLRPPACLARAELDMYTYPDRSAGTHCR